MYWTLILILSLIPVFVYIVVFRKKQDELAQSQKSKGSENDLKDRKFIDQTLGYEYESHKILQDLDKKTDINKIGKLGNIPTINQLNLINESGLIDYLWKLRQELIKDTLDVDPMAEEVYKNVLSEIEAVGNHDEFVVVKFNFEGYAFCLSVKKTRLDTWDQWNDDMRLHELDKIVVEISSSLEQKWSNEASIHYLKKHYSNINSVSFEGEWNRMLVACNEAAEKWERSAFE